MPRKIDHRKTVCCICGSRETYIRPDGNLYWHGHTCNKENCTKYKCHECFKKSMRDKNKNIKERYLEKRRHLVCAICGNSETGKLSNNESDWRKDKYRKGYWDGKSYLCTKCDGIVRSNLPDSQKNIIKYIRDSRIENLDRYTEHGKDVITQWIAAKTIGAKDMNIENNNFREPIDLSKHLIYGKIDVKSGTFNIIYKWWRIGIGEYSLNKDFDNLVILCMDNLWKYVERVYLIPRDRINVTSITIIKDLSRGGWYEEFRVDEKPYNDIYQSVEIPKRLSPFDLWKGKYDKKEIDQKSGMEK